MASPSAEGFPGFSVIISSSAPAWVIDTCTRNVFMIPRAAYIAFIIISASDYTVMMSFLKY